MRPDEKRIAFAFAGLGLVSLIGLHAFVPPIPQDQCYHEFADQRTMLGIPHFWNVVSNLPFLFVGILGWALASRPGTRRRTAWRFFAASVFLVGLGSGWYHLDPHDASLVLDRLPMTFAFMSLVCVLGAEAFGDGFERALLPLIVVGAASIAVWILREDLRLYGWVQFFPLLCVVIAVVANRPPLAHRGLVVAALGWYVAAKVAEQLDGEIEVLLGGLISGHPLKHVFAALGSMTLFVRLRRTP